MRAVLMHAFLRLAMVFVAAAQITLLHPVPAMSQEVVAIGIAAPLSGTFAPLGQRLRDGALSALAAHSARFRPVIADDRCSEEGGAAAGELLAGQQVAAVIGFLCGEALDAALPALSDSGTVILSPGVRAPSLRGRRGETMVFRLAPRVDDEAEAVGALLTRHWADQHFAILDDGTAYGRNLADTLRLAAEEAGLKPVLVDSYRPQMDNQAAMARRLHQAGATHAFVAGDRYDLGILARDAARLDFELTLASGEALRVPATLPDIPAGTLMVGLPAEESGGAGYAAAAEAAVGILLQALDPQKPGALAERLAQGVFETKLGSVRFDEHGNRTGNRFRLFRYDGSEFREVTP